MSRNLHPRSSRHIGTARLRTMTIGYADMGFFRGFFRNRYLDIPGIITAMVCLSEIYCGFVNNSAILQYSNDCHPLCE
jgi:hypothetical protein